MIELNFGEKAGLEVHRLVVDTTAIWEKWTDVKQEIIEFGKLNMNCQELIGESNPALFCCKHH
jgi:hypothetical protein